jgi:plasmid replication initiation protein
MSSLQRKIFNILLYEANQNIEFLKHHESMVIECRIPFSNLCKGLKFNSNNTQYLKESVDALASLKIEWNLLKDKIPTNISFLNLRVLHGSPTFFQDNTLNFSFHKVMLDLVRNPSIYGTIDVDLQSQFESKYSHSLYENSTRFINLHKDKIIQLHTFRKLLGVPEEKYQSMRELNRNVILPSIEEVNDRADFVVALDSIKIGRKVTGFKLSVTNKIISKEVNKLSDGIEKLCKEIGFVFGFIKEQILKNILKNYSEEYISEKIEYTKKYAKKELTGFYPIPYFISALKNDYKNTETKCPYSDKIPNQKNDWENGLYDLQSQLNHWKKMLDYAQAARNMAAVKTAKETIEQYEKKYTQHLLTRPCQDKVEMA